MVYYGMNRNNTKRRKSPPSGKTIVGLLIALIVVGYILPGLLVSAAFQLPLYRSIALVVLFQMALSAIGVARKAKNGGLL